MTRFALAAFAAMLAAGTVRAESVTIPARILEPAWKAADCDQPLKNEPRDAYDLGGNLKLVELPCWLAAYQAGSIFVVFDPALPERVRLLKFEQLGDKGFVREASLTMPSFDPKTKTLRSMHKGRGLGDCGTLGTWRWTGADFKLTGFWNKENCDGRPFRAEKRWQVFPKR